MQDKWISASRAAQLLEVARPTMDRIALAAGVRRRRLPGETFTRYSREDLERLCRESVVGAKAGA